MPLVHLDCRFLTGARCDQRDDLGGSGQLIPALRRQPAVRREGAIAIGATAVGALALGAVALGALAVGRRCEVLGLRWSEIDQQRRTA